MSLGDPQSFNRYAYVENQQTNFVDPSGLVRWGMCILVTWEGGESLFCSPQNARAVGSAGGPGTSSSGRGGGNNLRNDDWRKCMDEVEKEFSEPPRVSDDEWLKYTVDSQLAHDAHKLALNIADRQQNNSIYWGFLAGGVGAIVGGYFGGPKGAAVGATVGAGMVVGKEWGAHNINVDAANKAKKLTENAIRSKYPNAYKRELFNERKNSAIIKCSRLAIPSWLRST